MAPKALGVLVGALLVSQGALAGKVRVPAQYAANLKAAPDAQICRGAKALERAQGDFRGVGTQRSKATWEWERGSGDAAENTAGIVALALLETAKRCGRSDALQRYAQEQVTRHAAWAFLYDADVEVLAKLPGRAFRQIAKEAFDRRYDGATGDEIVARWLLIGARGTLVGYDAALAIRAALAVGDRAKAVELADAVVASMPRWAEGPDPRGHLTTSRGALLEALVMTDPERFNAPASDLADHLMLSQGLDGSWNRRSTQATAFAVRGLARHGETIAATSAQRGLRWLRLTQLKEGAWATFNDLVPEHLVGTFVPEVAAEALLALATIEGPSASFLE